MMRRRWLVEDWEVNRPLSDDERGRQLRHGQKSLAPAWHQVNVIRMNSTFLECVDDQFRGKTGGMMMTIAGCILAGLMMLLMTVMGILEWLGSSLKTVTLAIWIGCGFWLLLSWFFLKLHCFAYTHYPIRFNRKTRKVHAFRKNGTVMTEDWDKLFFFLTGGDSPWSMGVRFHRLSEDGDTVLENFGLPHETGKDDPLLLSFWEFVRLYMEGDENDLKALASQINHVLDVADEHETFKEAKAIVGFAPSDFLRNPFVALAIYVHVVFRWFGQRTNKIPVWPDEIEAQCRIEPNDPNLRDWEHLAAEDDWQPTQEHLDALRRM